MGRLKMQVTVDLKYQDYIFDFYGTLIDISRIHRGCESNV